MFLHNLRYMEVGTCVIHVASLRHESSSQIKLQEDTQGYSWSSFLSKSNLSKNHELDFIKLLFWLKTPDWHRNLCRTQRQQVEVTFFHKKHSRYCRVLLCSWFRFTGLQNWHRKFMTSLKVDCLCMSIPNAATLCFYIHSSLNHTLSAHMTP